MATNSINSGRTSPLSRKVNVKKVVRVRKASTNKARKSPVRNPNGSNCDKTVIFFPGPVGLQLEPVKGDLSCRVVRFVDGGPKKPGQARTSGKIRPGDLVVQVEAENDVATTYSEIIQVLMRTHAVRVLTFRSVWDTSFLETQSSLKLQTTLTADTFDAKDDNKHTSKSDFTENLSSENSVSPSCVTPLSKGETLFIQEPITPLPTPIFYENDPSAEKLLVEIDTDLIRSPSESVLLAHSVEASEKCPETTINSSHSVITPLDATQTASEPTPFTFPAAKLQFLSPPPLPLPSAAMPTNRTLNSSTKSSGVLNKAITLPPPPPPPPPPKRIQNNFQGQDGSPALPRNEPHTAPMLPREEESDVTKTKRKTMTETDKSRSVDTSAQSPSKNETSTGSIGMQAPILSTPLQPTTSAQPEPKTPFSPSNVKNLSRTQCEDKEGDRFVSRVLGTVASSSYAIGSAVATSSYAIGSAVTTKIGEKIIGNSPQDFKKAHEAKLQLLRELSHAKAALDLQSISKHDLERNMSEVFRENVSLRAQFEHKLRMARIEYVSIGSQIVLTRAYFC